MAKLVKYAYIVIIYNIGRLQRVNYNLFWYISEIAFLFCVNGEKFNSPTTIIVQTMVYTLIIVRAWLGGLMKCHDSNQDTDLIK